MGTETDLTAYGQPLTVVSSFKYLGSSLSVSDDGCPGFLSTIRNSLKTWYLVWRFLGWQRTYDRVLGTFYISVLQAVLLFVSEA